MNLFNIFLPYLSTIVKPDWTVYKDVHYGVSESQTADLYLLNRGVHPCVIFIHGGGWSAGDKSAYEGRARRYALAGFHVVAINYTLAKVGEKATQWPAQLQDVQNALQWVRNHAAHFRIDPNKIGVGGDSAGAHLALMLGTRPNPPVCILDMFGPTNLNEPHMKGMLASLPVFEGQPESVYSEASPINHITALFPPTLVVHGTQDETVHFEQSLELVYLLDQRNVRHKFVPFEGGHETGKLSSWEQVKLEMEGIRFFSDVMNV